MKFIPTAIPEVVLIEPVVHRDARGFFLESYHADKFKAAGIDVRFVQENHSRSARGTLRGLHAQRTRPQGKLIRCTLGEIFDVAADLRPGSSTYGRHVTAVLSAENFRQLWVPPGFLHGFCVTTDAAEVEYKCTDVYAPGDEIGVLWNDADLSIDWPTRAPLLSHKDAALPTFAEMQKLLRGSR